MELASLLPDGVAPLGALALVAISVLTSAVTACLGIGGGVLLLIAMTFVVPIEALIAVHGAVQLGSNAGRTIVLLPHVRGRALLPYFAGAVVGIAIGVALVTDLPGGVVLLAIGLFVLLTTWLKIPPLGRGAPGFLAGGGLVASILTMFVGATGPLIMAVMRQIPMPHKELVATNGAAMTAQQGLKVAAFALVGFAYLPWLPLLVALIAAGAVGTVLGTKLIDKTPEATLRLLLKYLLTILGIQLVVRGLMALL